MTRVRRKTTVVLIPAKDEAVTIGNVVSSLKNEGFTVVCVDDGSTDSTPRIAAENGAIVLRHPINRGQGAAFRTGLNFVKNNLSNIEFVITFDADGQHDVQDAIKINDLLVKREVNLVLGSRFLEKKNTEISQIPLIKKYLLKIFIKINSLNKEFRTTDIHNGIRGMSLEIAELLEIKEDGYAHAEEFTRLVSHPKSKFKEIPVTITYTKYSKQKGQPLSNGLIMLVDKLWK
jgi:glycosyltransferase involved in cell wall biosynthesis